MRNQTVTVNGKQVVVKEHKIKELKNDIAPKITGALNGLDLADLDIRELPATLIGSLQEKLSEFFPELSPGDIDEAYPSEIEELIKAWIDVNFSGLKKMAIPLFGLMKLGTSKQQ